jgi:predicted AAA+ superfamily ATPase
LVKFIARNTGNLISAKKISDYLKSQNIKMSPQIVLDYLQYLENAFLVFKVKRTDLSGKKIFEMGEKYYFEDIGIKNALSGESHFEINQVIENVIYINLKIAGYEVTVGSFENKEIDFICQKQGKKLYIQAAYLLPDAKVREREFGNLLQINDNYRKIVVSLDKFAPHDYNGIEHFYLPDFLTQIENFS